MVMMDRGREDNLVFVFGNLVVANAFQGGSPGEKMSEGAR